MAVTSINGDMFSISIDGPRAQIRIWRRPDIDSDTGAKNAARIAEEGAKLPVRGVRAVLLDVKDAPAVAGPKSIASISVMMSAWAAARMRVAIFVGSDDAIKVLQFRRVVTEHAPRDARIITDAAEAAKWLASVA
jgi:hypothetical protein